MTKTELNSDVAATLVAVAVIVPLALLMNGWALHLMWGWFFTPIGIPPVSVPHAIGVAGCVGLVTASRASNETEPAGALYARLFLSPLFVVAVGWVVKSFM